jgi:hypothetical protein
MKLKNVLRRIHPNSANLFHGRSPLSEISNGPQSGTSDAVGGTVGSQFDKARHAFIYSWFAYDLVSLAEQQGYQTLELALREKLPADERKRADKKRGVWANC